MKVTSVEIHSPSTTPVLLSFRDPKALNPYNAISIDGLDTDLIVPKYYGTSDDSKFYNLIRKKRTVILQIGLNPDYDDLETYSQLRDDLYRLISSSRFGEIQLQFKDGNTVVAAISGLVSKLETDQFDRDQEVKLTLVCKDPMLKSLTPVGANFNVSDPRNLVIQDDKSTAPHGFSFVAKFRYTVPVLSILNEEAGFSFIIRPRDPFAKEDLLYFSSDFNEKYLYMVRGGVKMHLADVIDLHPIWPIIFPGTNEYQIDYGGGIFWQSISHYETYWGV